jgi:HK97 family phage major capsid protein
VRKLKDNNKQYIWMPGLQNGAPNTIDGDPYVEVPDMPNEGAGNTPIVYGDFRRAYTWVDRISMEMLRDPYTQATSPATSASSCASASAARWCSPRPCAW